MASFDWPPSGLHPLCGPGMFLFSLRKTPRGAFVGMEGIERYLPWFWHARIRLFMEVNHLEPGKHNGKHHISRYLEGMFFLAIKGCSKSQKYQEIFGSEKSEKPTSNTLCSRVFLVFFGALVLFMMYKCLLAIGNVLYIWIVCSYLYHIYALYLIYRYLFFSVFYKDTPSLAKMFFFVS